MTGENLNVFVLAIPAAATQRKSRKAGNVEVEPVRSSAVC